MVFKSLSEGCNRCCSCSHQTLYCTCFVTGTQQVYTFRTVVAFCTSQIRNKLSWFYTSEQISHSIMLKEKTNNVNKVKCLFTAFKGIARILFHVTVCPRHLPKKMQWIPQWREDFKSGGEVVLLGSRTSKQCLHTLEERLWHCIIMLSCMLPICKMQCRMSQAGSTLRPRHQHEN